MRTAHDPRLAALGFQLVRPRLELRPYIRAYWYLRRDTPLQTYTEQYMHPRGGIGLAFNLADPVYLGGQLVAEPVFFDGTTTVSRTMGFLGRLDLVGVSFRAGGAYPVIGVPLAEIRDGIGLLEALDIASVMQLHTQLFEERSTQARIQQIEAWLLRRLALGRALSALIPASLALLRSSGPVLPIPRLAEQLAVSQRQLERLYYAQVGMSPKQYAQLIRVERARLTLKRGQVQSTADLAVDLGFYDQSHFIRDFSAVVGMTPNAYSKRSRQQAAGQSAAEHADSTPG
jgi:AraC-like DNA-binding protein